MTPSSQSTVSEKPESQKRKSYACAHGKRKSRCKDCGGSDTCEHGKERRRCKDCGGSGICEHSRIRRQYCLRDDSYP